jgi:hypothetical protein
MVTFTSAPAETAAAETAAAVKATSAPAAKTPGVGLLEEKRGPRQGCGQDGREQELET